MHSPPTLQTKAMEKQVERPGDNVSVYLMDLTVTPTLLLKGGQYTSATSRQNRYW
jgi:hypothetical protein